MNIKYLLNTVVILFVVMDSFGGAPIFLTTLKNIPINRRKKILYRELLIALIAFLIFYFLGEFVLDILGISIEAVKVGGGVVLFLIAMNLIFPKIQKTENSFLEEEPFIVPLAIPILAGPAALSVIMIMQRANDSKNIENLLAIIIAWGLSSLVIICGDKLHKVLKDKGMRAIEKLVGLILIILSIQMLLDGIGKFYKLM